MRRARHATYTMRRVTFGVPDGARPLVWGTTRTHLMPYGTGHDLCSGRLWPRGLPCASLHARRDRARNSSWHAACCTDGTIARHTRRATLYAALHGGGHVVSIRRRTSLSRNFYCVLLVHSAVPPNPGQARLRLLHASVRPAAYLRATCALRATRSNGTENHQLASKTTQLAPRNMQHAAWNTQHVTRKLQHRVVLLVPTVEPKHARMAAAAHADPRRSAHVSAALIGVCFARGIVCCIVASLHRCIVACYVHVVRLQHSRARRP
jgi:hypothetical protein